MVGCHHFGLTTNVVWPTGAPIVRSITTLAVLYSLSLIKASSRLMLECRVMLTVDQQDGRSNTKPLCSITAIFSCIKGVDF